MYVHATCQFKGNGKDNGAAPMNPEIVITAGLATDGETRLSA
jgi:hypothetical protein